jgi:nitroreductase
MELIDLIHKRRSIRSFIEKDIGNDDLQTILSAAMTAPSAMNKQPWEFIIVRNNETKKEVAKISQHAQMVTQSPLSILVCADTERSFANAYPVDCAASIQNLLLSAFALGIGSVWTGIYGKEKLEEDFKNLFKLPNNITPIALIVLGYTDAEFIRKDYFDKKKVHEETWI